VAVADWITSFKALFPEFMPILNGSGEDVTDDTISTYLDLTMDMLPQALICYMSRASVMNLLYYATAHMLTYYNIKDGYGEAKTMTMNATSMSAQGLSVSYAEYAKMKGDMFPSLVDFLNTTAYGRSAALWLEKMSGSVGGFSI
jgi:hypothetical protein